MAAAAAAAELAQLKVLFDADPGYWMTPFDIMHDSGDFLGIDRHNQLRTEAAYAHLWKAAKFSVFRKGLGMTPVNSTFFNGCGALRMKSKVEETGLEWSRQLAQPLVLDVPYNRDVAGGPNDFYTRLYEILSGGGGRPDYMAEDRKIPIVIDTEFTLHTNEGLREFVDRFSVCKNKETFADPSRISATRTFNTATAIEVGEEVRTYLDNSRIRTGIHTSIGNIIVSGTPQSVTINYGAVLEENYLVTDSVLPNSIAATRDSFDSILGAPDQGYKNTLAEVLTYCGRYLADGEMPDPAAIYGPNGYGVGNVAYLRAMAAHMVKKKLADQLQVASCLRRIRYQKGREIKQANQLIWIPSEAAPVEYGGTEKPCVFWSYDRLAIAFAILLGIPCVRQYKNGNVKVYIPTRAVINGDAPAVGGAACTRANFQGYNPRTSSTVLTHTISGSLDCLQYYVKSHFIPGELTYNPIYVLSIFDKFFGIIQKGDELVRHLNGLTGYPQLHIEGDHEGPGTWGPGVKSILEGRPDILFYSYNHGFYIKISRRDKDNEFVFTLYRTAVDRGVEGVGNPELYSFNNTSFNIANENELIEVFNQNVGADINANINADPNVNIEGGAANSPKRKHSISRTKLNPLLKLLSDMTRVERIFLIFPDNAESFYVKNKSYALETGAYKAYEIIFFFKAMIEELQRESDKESFSHAFAHIFTILKELKEDYLEGEILSFLSTFHTHKYKETKTYTEKDVGTIKKVLSLSKKYLKEFNDKISKFKYNEKAMDNFTEKEMPLGMIDFFYSQAYKILNGGEYSKKSVQQTSLTRKNIKKLNNFARSNNGRNMLRRLRASNLENTSPLMSPKSFFDPMAGNRRPLVFGGSKRKTRRSGGR